MRIRPRDWPTNRTRTCHNTAARHVHWLERCHTCGVQSLWGFLCQWVCVILLDNDWGVHRKQNQGTACRASTCAAVSAPVCAQQNSRTDRAAAFKCSDCIATHCYRRLPEHDECLSTTIHSPNDVIKHCKCSLVLEFRLQQTAPDWSWSWKATRTQCK